MPLGWATDGGGWSGPDLDEAARRARELAEWIREEAERIEREAWRWVERVEDVATWVRALVPELYGVAVMAYQTAGDERTCPECAPWHGARWAVDEGQPAPDPPLHVNCRCRITEAGTVWRTRYVDAWRLDWSTRAVWEWKRTGWQ